MGDGSVSFTVFRVMFPTDEVVKSCGMVMMASVYFGIITYFSNFLHSFARKRASRSLVMC